MYQPKSKIKCTSCGKTVCTVDKSREMCNKCLSWKKPGKGQTDMFSNDLIN